MRKRILLLAVLAALLAGCGARSGELPPPAQLSAAILAGAGLPDMVDTAGTDLEALTGIGPELYEQAVCLRLREGTAPDEIIIVRARSGGAAETVQALLERRLDYKRESGALYLTEYQPMLRAGSVRRDGLTVSLIVSGQAEAVAQLLARAA